MGYFVESLDLRKKPQTVHLFLAEGEAEVGLVESYLATRGASVDENTIVCFRGVTKMAGHCETIVKLLAPSRDTLERIRGIALFADADDNAGGRLATVIECAKAFGFVRPGGDLEKYGIHNNGGRTFAFALSPSNRSVGRIEDLILSELAQSPVLSCIESSIPCISSAIGSELNTKAVVQIAISALMNNSMSGIRRAFNAGVFKVAHSAYENHRSVIDSVLAT